MTHREEFDASSPQLRHAVLHDMHYCIEAITPILAQSQGKGAHVVLPSSHYLALSTLALIGAELVDPNGHLLRMPCGHELN